MSLFTRAIFLAFVFHGIDIFQEYRSLILQKFGFAQLFLLYFDFFLCCSLILSLCIHMCCVLICESLSPNYIVNSMETDLFCTLPRMYNTWPIIKIKYVIGQKFLHIIQIKRMLSNVQRIYQINELSVIKEVKECHGNNGSIILFY